MNLRACETPERHSETVVRLGDRVVVDLPVVEIQQKKGCVTDKTHVPSLGNPQFNPPHSL